MSWCTQQRCWQSQRTRISNTGEELRQPELGCRESPLKTGGPKGAKGSLFSASCEELTPGIPGCGKLEALRFLEVQCSPRMRQPRRSLKNPVTPLVRSWANSVLVGTCWSSGSGFGNGGCTAFPPCCHWTQRTPAPSCLWAMDKPFSKSSQFLSIWFITHLRFSESVLASLQQAAARPIHVSYTLRPAFLAHSFLMVCEHCKVLWRVRWPHEVITLYVTNLAGKINEWWGLGLRESCSPPTDVLVSSCLQIRYFQFGGYIWLLWSSLHFPTF